MKVVQISRYGGSEVLELSEAPEPIAARNEVVVDIHAASLNPGDVKVRKGLRPEFVKGVFPHIMGRDFSGVIRAVGSGVTEFAPGDSVFGVLEAGREGTYAESVGINADLIAKKPARLSHAEIVAVALTGLTALYALEDAAQLDAGETILIHGGAGGVGGFAIQYAQHVGARVITTASAQNHEYVRGLGAEKAIDYHSQDFTKIVTGCDVVFDLVGGEVQKRSLSVLRSGGRLVTIASITREVEGVRSDVTVLRPDVRRDRAHLERIAELVGTGAIHPPQIKTFPLAQVKEAHELFERGGLKGKIVLTVR